MAGDYALLVLLLGDSTRQIQQFGRKLLNDCGEVDWRDCQIN